MANSHYPAWTLRCADDIMNKSVVIKKIVKMDSYLSVDEYMIEYFAHHPIKQFMKGKLLCTQTDYFALKSFANRYFTMEFLFNSIILTYQLMQHCKFTR